MLITRLTCQVTNSAQVSASSLLHDNDVDDDVDVRQMSSDLRLVLYGSAQDHPPVHTTQSSAEKYVWVSEEPGSVTPAFALAPEWSGIFRTGISEHAGNSLPRSAALRA